MSTQLDLSKLVNDGAPIPTSDEAQAALEVVRRRSSIGFMEVLNELLRKVDPKNNPTVPVGVLKEVAGDLYKYSGMAAKQAAQAPIAPRIQFNVSVNATDAVNRRAGVTIEAVPTPDPQLPDLFSDLGPIPEYAGPIGEDPFGS